jgi:hypothetical protein
LVDSSLDWGQDLPGLKGWLDQQGLQGPGHAPVFLSYFGNARPEYYKIEATRLPSFPDRWSPRLPQPLTGGVYCVSATMLQAVYLDYPGAWTAEYEEKYQTTLDNLRVFAGTEGNERARAQLLRQTGEDFWWRAFHAFEQLRFARLAAHLRQREPDAQVGYSILIYRISDADVLRMVTGPSP